MSSVTGAVQIWRNEQKATFVMHLICLTSADVGSLLLVNNFSEPFVHFPTSLRCLSFRQIPTKHWKPRQRHATCFSATGAKHTKNLSGNGCKKKHFFCALKNCLPSKCSIPRAHCALVFQGVSTNYRPRPTLLLNIKKSQTVWHLADVLHKRFSSRQCSTLRLKKSGSWRWTRSHCAFWIWRWNYYRSLFLQRCLLFAGDSRCGALSTFMPPLRQKILPFRQQVIDFTDFSFWIQWDLELPWSTTFGKQMTYFVGSSNDAFFGNIKAPCLYSLADSKVPLRSRKVQDCPERKSKGHWWSDIRANTHLENGRPHKSRNTKGARVCIATDLKHLRIKAPSLQNTSEWIQDWGQGPKTGGMDKKAKTFAPVVQKLGE